MNPTSSNHGGYKSCALRKALNTEILDRFPAEIREKMVAFPNGDLLRLPTEKCFIVRVASLILRRMRAVLNTQVSVKPSCAPLKTLSSCGSSTPRVGYVLISSRKTSACRKPTDR